MLRILDPAEQRLAKAFDLRDRVFVAISNIRRAHQGPSSSATGIDPGVRGLYASARDIALDRPAQFPVAQAFAKLVVFIARRFFGVGFRGSVQASSCR